MSKLTDEQINTIAAPWSWVNMNYTEEQKKFARAIEAAATEPLLQRIAELEQRNSDLHEDVQRFKKHALNEKAARMELERQLEEARNHALEKAAVECDKRAHAGDAGALMSARAIRALKGAKE